MAGGCRRISAEIANIRQPRDISLADAGGCRSLRRDICVKQITMWIIK
jgi:hypothetical protein